MFINRKLTVIDIIFIIIGGKFYMDWLLPTNPTSKNIIWRTLMSIVNLDYSAKNYKSRYKLGLCLMTLHFIMFLCFLFDGIVINILCNVYPIIVNAYIVIRLKKVITHKESLFYLKNYPYICNRNLKNYVHRKY